MTEGTSQRWRIRSENGVSLEKSFTSGDEQGSVHSENEYSFTLISTTNGHIESVVSLIAAVSLHNTVLDCTGHTSRVSLTLHIAGTHPLALRLMCDICNNYNFDCVFTIYHA